MENGSTVVAVAVGQIRSGRLRYHKDAMSYEVLEVSGYNATIRQDGHQSTAGIALEDLLRWPCIGLVTPHGRVMVGERRQAPSGAEGFVCAVLWTQPDRSGVSFDVGLGPTECLAEDVARWPLISPPAPAEPVSLADLTGDLTPAECNAYQQAIEDCNRAICGHSTDPREQGPGISRLPPPEVRPDVVVTAAWDRWSLP